MNTFHRQDRGNILDWHLSQAMEAIEHVQEVDNTHKYHKQHHLDL